MVRLSLAGSNAGKATARYSRYKIMSIVITDFVRDEMKVVSPAETFDLRQNTAVRSKRK
jgi:hypothetical protein